MNNKNLNYGDLFDQEFLNLAGIENSPIKGILSYMDLQEVYKDTDYVGNYFNPRYLEPQGIYIPFGSKSISGSERKAANEIFHDCLRWLENFVFNVIGDKVKGKEGAVREIQYVPGDRISRGALLGKIKELLQKNKECKCVCIGTQNIISRLMQDLNKFININDIDYVSISNNSINNTKAYIFIQNSIVIGCRTKFIFFSKPDIYRYNTLLCQAQGEFDAVISDENSVLAIDVNP